MSTALRVLVVDDQQIVRDGLATVLDLLPDVDVVGTAGDGGQALELVALRRPDVVLMDLHMPVLDGVAATRRIVAEHPGTAVLILTTFAQDDDALEALRAGARGVLTKDAGRDEISRALHQAAAGHMTLAEPLQARLLAAASPPQAPLRAQLPDGLTPREAEVLGLIAAGFTNREIAARLVVSEATVKTHINHLFAKIDARDRAAASNYAARHGLRPACGPRERPPAARASPRRRRARSGIVARHEVAVGMSSRGRGGRCRGGARCPGRARRKLSGKTRLRVDRDPGGTDPHAHGALPRRARVRRRALLRPRSGARVRARCEGRQAGACEGQDHYGPLRARRLGISGARAQRQPGRNGGGAPACHDHDDGTAARSHTSRSRVDRRSCRRRGARDATLTRPGRAILAPTRR